MTSKRPLRHVEEPSVLPTMPFFTVCVKNWRENLNTLKVLLGLPYAMQCIGCRTMLRLNADARTTM